MTSKKAQPKKHLITRDMPIAEVVANYPTTAGIMAAYGLHCFDCGAASLETLEQGTLGHGMSEEDLEMILADVNEEAERVEKEAATSQKS